MATVRTNVTKIGEESGLVIYESKVVLPPDITNIRLYAVSGGHSVRNPSDPPSGIFDAYVAIFEGMADAIKDVLTGQGFSTDQQPPVNSAILRVWQNGNELPPKFDKNFENYYLKYDLEGLIDPPGKEITWKVGSANFIAKETQFEAFIEITSN